MEYLEKQIEKEFPVSEWKRRRVCLAVSGGPDSVALLRAFHAISQRENLSHQICAVTVDHQLRGTESDADVTFVRSLSQMLGIDFRLKRLPQLLLQEEKRRVGSLENAARTLRYQYLQEAAHDFGARYIVTAHHKGDQLETILFRLFRGSGIDGLRGMTTTRVLDESLVLVRPMLNLTKSQILEYLYHLKQNYRFDSSNTSSEYSRNRIRNELTILLDEIFPNKWQNALERLAQQCTRTAEYFDKELDNLEKKLVEASNRDNKFSQELIRLHASESNPSIPKPDAIVIPLKTLEEYPSEILMRFFRRLWIRENWHLSEMGYEEWNELVEMVQKRKTRRCFPGRITATLTRNNQLVLKKQKSHSSNEK